jgi:hypothetical protein
MMSALMTLPILLAAATATAPADHGRSLESRLEKARTHLKLDRAYTPGEPIEMTLAPGEGARLKFAANKAGVSEFVFLYEPGAVEVMFVCEGEKKLHPHHADREASRRYEEHQQRTRAVDEMRHRVETPGRPGRHHLPWRPPQ